MAGLMLCEVRLRDNAATNVEGVEDKEYPFEFAGVNPADVREDWAFLELWRLCCKALARAFSWVRTKLARFYNEIRLALSLQIE